MVKFPIADYSGILQEIGNSDYINPIVLGSGTPNNTSVLLGNNSWTDIANINYWVKNGTEISYQGDVLVGKLLNSGFAKFQVDGAIQQSVVSKMLKANLNGVIVEAVDGTDYYSPTTIASANYWTKVTNDLRYNLGHVGVGTTSAHEGNFKVGNLTVGAPATTGTTDAAASLIVGYANNTWQGGELHFGTYNTTPGDYASWIQARNPTDYAINRNLILQPNGSNVGIGTTNPTSKLTVIGDIMVRENDDGFNAAGLLADNTGGYLRLYGTGTLRVNLNGNTNGDSYFNTGGKLGINIATPLEVLDLNGTIKAGSSSTDGNILLYGRYSNGILASFGSMRSSGGTYMAYALKPSITVGGGWESSTAANLGKSGIIAAGGLITMSVAAASIVADGTAVTPTDMVRINNTGVAINRSTTAAYSLDVGGIGRISDTSNPILYFGITDSINAGIGMTSGNLLRFSVGTAGIVSDTKMVIDSSGNVGIGVTNPTRELTLKENFVLGWRYTTSNSGSFHRITGGGANPINFKVDYTGAATTPIFTFDGNAVNIVTMLNGGNVGIGTTNPLTQFVVNGLGQTVATMTTSSGNMGGVLSLQDTGTAAGAGGAILFGANQGSSVNVNFAGIKGLLTNSASNGQGDIAFSTRFNATDATLTEAFRVKANGNILMGNADNGFGKLQVTGNIYNSALVGTEAILKTTTTGVISRATGADIATLLGNSAEGNYIRNQNVAEQSGNSWISGASRATSFSARTATDGGYVRLVAGNATQTGYLEIRKADTTRLGYIGFNNVNLQYVVENNANHYFSGGKILVNTTTDNLLDDIQVNGSGMINSIRITRNSVSTSTFIGANNNGRYMTGTLNTIIGSGNAYHVDITTGVTGADNTIVGASSGNKLTTGGGNTFVGRSVYNTYSVGTHNVALGFNTMSHASWASYNIVIGANAGKYLGNTSATISTNTHNVYLGAESGYSNATVTTNNVGYYNVGLGYRSLFSIENGNYNIGIGHSSLLNLKTGNYNIGLNYLALEKNNNKSHNVAIGYAAMRYYGGTNVAEDTSNIAIGREALQGNATTNNLNTGIHNLALGYRALYVNESGGNNVALSGNTLLANKIGNYNVSIGYDSMVTSVALNYNVAIGNGAQRYANSVAESLNSFNTSVGYNSLRGSATAANNTGVRNSTFGANSMTAITSGSQNVVMGYSAGNGITTGSNNTYLGYEAGATNPTGYGNAYVGINAGRGASGSSAYENVAIGGNGLLPITTGYRNVAVGYDSLKTLTTGINNIGLGFSSGSAITTGQSNVIIGGNTGTRIATLSNWMLFSDGNGTERFSVNAAGNSMFGANDDTIYGLAYKLNVNTGSDTGLGLYVKGSIRTTGDISSLLNVIGKKDWSDRRLKSNIQLFTDYDKINQLKVKTFDIFGKNSVGLIAQEVKKVFPFLVSKSEDKYFLNYNAVASLALANTIKQSSELDKCKEQIKELQQRVTYLESQLNATTYR